MDERRLRFEAQALPHLDAAYNLARWLTRSPADADDIVQEAMLRAFRSFDGFRGDTIKPWLLAIVRNCWKTAAGDRRRRDHTSLDEEGGPEPASEAPDPEAEALHASEGRRFADILAGLPEEFREALVLREIEDMSYREIAETTGAPIGTVMSRLARARALLKDRWQVEDPHGLR